MSFNGVELDISTIRAAEDLFPIGLHESLDASRIHGKIARAGRSARVVLNILRSFLEVRSPGASSLSFCTRSFLARQRRLLLTLSSPMSSLATLQLWYEQIQRSHFASCPHHVLLTSVRAPTAAE